MRLSKHFTLEEMTRSMVAARRGIDNTPGAGEIKNLGEHPEDKKPVRVMKGKFGPYIKYKSLNATIPEEKDPNEITMEEALILIEKRKEYDKTKKTRKKK